MLALSFVGATAYELRAATTAQFRTSVAASRRAGVPPPRAAILDSPEDLATPEFEVVLADPETAREMQCHMLETVDDGAQLYASMTPVDTPVAITAHTRMATFDLAAQRPRRLDAAEKAWLGEWA